MSELINKQIKNNSLAHSYFLVSDNSEELFLWFKNLKEKLNIKNVDVFEVDNEKQIKIEDVRQLQEKIRLKPHSSAYKLFFLYNASNLRIEASNALLKTLEEPAGKSIIVLAGLSIDSVLPTILSRCQIIRVPFDLAQGRAVIDREEYLRIKGMPIYKKFQYAKELSEKEDLNKWFDNLIIFFRSNIENKQNREILKKILNYQTIINNTNVNKQLLLENMLLDIE